MADHISIKITNAAEIKSAYSKAPALMTKALSTVIKMAVFIIHALSASNTPVLTGRLRGSTYSKFKPLRGEVGTNTDYDKFVHEGTKFMKAQPYLRMAVESSNSEINSLFVQATQNVLNDIGKAA